MARRITNSDDIIDSRDVIERIEELTAEWEETTGDTASEYGLSEEDWAVGLGEAEAHELVALLALAKQGEDCVADWAYGEALIRDSYFEDYARELVTDCGYLPADLPEWVVVDWEETADNVQQDYTALEFDGATYYAR